MRKLLFNFIIVLGLFLLSLSVQAKVAKVVSLQHFSTQFPLEVYNVQTLDRIQLDNGFVLEPGTIVAGKVVKVEHPKMFHKNAYFEFVPTLVSYKGSVKEISDPKYVAQIIGYRHIDSEKAAIFVAKNATNFLTLGSSLVISAVQGLGEAEEGERGKAVAAKIYKDSPLFFVNVGTELDINVGDELKFQIKQNR